MGPTPNFGLRLEVRRRLSAGENYREIALATGKSKERIGQIARSIGIAGAGRMSPFFIERTWGITTDQYTAIIKTHGRKPFIGFLSHRGRARNSGIGFKLTFWEWWRMWEMSGHWSRRGRGANDYCMARTKDQGDYVVGNVRICSNRENRAEYYEVSRHLK